MSTEASDGVPVITKEQLESLIGGSGQQAGASSKILLLDVREPGEMQQTGMIPSARGLPLTKLQHALQLDEDDFEEEFAFPKRELKESRVVCYCRAGVRSETAARILQEFGNASVANYKGSFLEWFPDRFY